MEGNYLYWSKYSEGMILFKNYSDYFGYMDTSGNIVIPNIYDEAGVFVGSLAPVCKDQKWGFINYRGDITIPLIYDHAEAFSEGLACVWVGDYCGWINNTGRFVIPLMYQCSANCVNGVINTELNGKQVMIDASGKLILEHSGGYKFIYNDEFCGYLIHVTDKYTGLCGLLDMNGNVVVPCKYQDLSQFHYGGYAQIRNDGLWGLIDATGNEIFQCEFKHWILPYKGRFYTNIDGRAVVYNRHFNTATGCYEICEILSSGDFRFDHQWLKDNYMVVRSSSELYGIVDQELQVVLPLEYDSIQVIEGTNIIYAEKSEVRQLINLQC